MDESFEFINASDRASEALKPFLWEPLLALDTETFWNPDFGRNSVSLIQIAAPDRPALVLDAVAIDRARRLCEVPAALIARAKRAVNEGLEVSLADGLALEKRLGN